MKQIYIRGGMPLNGQVRIQGSKNAALPVMAAALLAEGEHQIRNCPKIADVYGMLEILKSLGVKCRWEGRTLYLDSREIVFDTIGDVDTKSMRSSVFLLGALLGRCKEVDLAYPGGCVIGNRPIDWHIIHLNKMGVIFCDSSTRMKAKVKHLQGCEHRLLFPSVGVTENLIMASVLAEGETVIYGAAREPEIVTLCEFLRSGGAKIRGDGKSVIRIEGVKKLHDASIRLPGDRIVAGTYALACMMTSGDVLLEEAPISHLSRLIPLMHAMGGNTICMEDGLYVHRKEKLKAIPYICTEVYPGFPTDLQSPLMAVLSVAEGESIIEEKIFDNRFRIVSELRSMGADIHVLGTCAYIRGVKGLKGASIRAMELRGGAALVIAGLSAEGETYINDCDYIYRGYENICRDLTELGARIYSE